MDWLKDSKNLPIIAGITGLVITIAVVFLIMNIRKSSDQGAIDYQMPDQYGTYMPTMTLPDSMDPTTPPPTPVTTSTTIAPPEFPVERYRLDPFRPFQEQVAKAPPAPPLYVPSPGRLFPPRAAQTIVEELERQAMEMTPQPRRRMSGLLYNQRLYAILETEGRAQVVKPGDITSDGTARVEVIEPRRIVLRTLDERNPRTIEVKMAAADQPDDTMTAPSPTTPRTYGPHSGSPTMTLPEM